MAVESMNRAPAAFEFIHRGSGMEIRQHARRYGLLDRSGHPADCDIHDLFLVIDEEGCPGFIWDRSPLCRLDPAEWAIRWRLQPGNA